MIIMNYTKALLRRINDKMKIEKLFEDIIDDIGTNTKDYRPYEVKDRDNFTVSKNKKNWHSAALAKDKALNATEEKEKANKPFKR
mgnify:CR=1 FL=1